MTARNLMLHIASLIVLLVATSPAGAATNQDILRPEQAFRYTVSADGDEIVVRWNIEPEHYLYKERMHFASRTGGVKLGDARMPAGKPYSDEFFGDMHVYRGAADVRLPIAARAAGARTLDLEIRSQGCADIGLCYPPQTWVTTVALPPQAGGTDTSGSALSRLMSTAPPNAGEPLPPEQAFRPDVVVVDPFTLRVAWTIADGYYLYRDSLKFASKSKDAEVGTPVMPAGKTTIDEHFGETQAFYNSVSVDLPLTRAGPELTTIPLVMEYQGCKTDSICYPPQLAEFQVDLPAASSGDAPRVDPGAPGMVSEQDRLSGMIMSGNLLVVVVTFIGLGLLLAFTPCVLPMVPILSGIIAGQGKDITTRRAFTLSLTYVLGMALTYTAAGAAFGAMGGQIQAALQKPWIIVSVALLFGALALSMFGLYELQMPSALQTRLAAASNRQKSGTFIGTAVMGVLSALIVTTCVAPPLVAAMTVIAQAGDVTRGALALFSMSIGMGIPLLIVGTSAGRLLPSAGAWMDKVKGAFGFMMLGLAIWMLERILPAPVTMTMWAVLVFMAGVFLGAFQLLGETATAPQKLGKGAGLLASIYGAALLLGALSGQTNPLQPLRFGVTQIAQTDLEFQRIKSVADLDRELERAAATGQPVMLDFYADWCVSCKEMEHYTFTDAAVRASLAGTRLLQADVTANDAVDRELLQRFGIFGPPTIIFFDPLGNERSNFRVVGFMPPETFAPHVDSAFSATLPPATLSDNAR